MIEDGDHIILDPSTTAVFIAKALKAKERLTVITNSIEVILELSDVSDWNIISSGGSLKEGYLALVEHYLAQEPLAYHVELLAAHYRHDAGLLGAALLAQGE